MREPSWYCLRPREYQLSVPVLSARRPLLFHQSSERQTGATDSCGEGYLRLAGESRSQLSRERNHSQRPQAREHPYRQQLVWRKRSCQKHCEFTGHCGRLRVCNQEEKLGSWRRLLMRGHPDSLRIWNARPYIFRATDSQLKDCQKDRVWWESWHMVSRNHSVYHALQDGNSLRCPRPFRQRRH